MSTKTNDPKQTAPETAPAAEDVKTDTAAPAAEDAKTAPAAETEEIPVKKEAKKEKEPKEKKSRLELPRRLWSWHSGA